MKYPHYSQVDPRWKNQLVTTRRLGEIGCLITSLAMKFAGEGVDVTPSTLDNWLDTHDGYQKNLVKWDSVLEFCAAHGLPYTEYVKRPWSSRARCDQGRAQIGEVLTPRSTTHFVLLTSLVNPTFLDPGKMSSTLFIPADRDYRMISVRELL